MNVQDLEKVHATGFDLEDVKVTFKHEIKIKVGDVNIEGKEGEILNIPRWIAKVLEKENHVIIQDTDMAIELKQAIVKERAQGDFNLSSLEPHFYIKTKSFMQGLEKRNYDEMHAMLNSLVRTRLGKIVFLAESSKMTSQILKSLTVEERELYNNLSNICAEFSKQIIGEKNE